jgi:lactoylglutathione lyase
MKYLLLVFAISCSLFTNGQTTNKVKMTNQMKSLSPNLMVNNVNETLDFYVTILGFTKVVTVPDTGKLDWAMVQSGAVTFMFQEKENIKTEYPQLKKFEQGGGLTFYINVTNVQELFDSLKGKVKIAKEMHKTFYGATDFAIEDLNGYILTFSQGAN